MDKNKVKMQLHEYLVQVDDFEHPTSLAYPLVLGGFACVAAIIVGLISFLDPYMALVACAFVFMVVLITANIRFYRRRKYALQLMAQLNGSTEINTVHGGEVCQYLDSTEIHLPQSPTSVRAVDVVIDDNGDDGDDGVGVVVDGDVRENGPYSRIDALHLSKDPSNHLYLNYRKEAQSDPEKDKLYINPRRSLVHKTCMEGINLLLPKNSVEETNLVPKNSVKETILVPKNSVEETDLVQKNSVEETNLVQKNSVEETNLVPKNSVEETNLVPKNSVEETNLVPKNSVEETNLVPKNSVEETEDDVTMLYSDVMVKDE
ncbi:hypothetical protein Pmani_026215 [Petrolisthes manimaculis]|uniref:Uncharacterized protein n=1 Tax=Petrolisthes manimaculis TaxID=1843537 RepID=A0AAE1P6L6_9EUCA|nr:hypothetical protein Pmani_026215 [Petrolisthes manimaculis]